MSTINYEELKITDLLNLSAHAVSENIKRLQLTRARLAARLVELETAGISSAQPYYRAEKYLYLIHPMVNGIRRREYIGTKPAKQAAALAAIDRGKEHIATQEIYSDLTWTLTRVAEQLTEIDRALQRELKNAKTFQLL